LAGLIIWLAQGILIEQAEITDVAYAQGQTAQRPDERRSVAIERPPLRFIKDPNPAFSAVAVDSDSNMLVTTDENLFQIFEFDSRTNTPSQARLSEPKRIIAGTNTMAEMMCGVYIDPATRDIYVVNGDTQAWMPVFSTDARGNVKPNRYLHVPGHPFGMAADEKTQLLYLVIQSNNRIDIYRKPATGNEKPVRSIAGADTQLEDPHGIGLDTKNNLMYVSNFGNAQVRGENGASGYGKFEPPSITVYPLNASGNAKPLYTIEGPATLLNWPSHMTFHEERQELFVANDADSSILVFRAGDKGNVAPIRVIKGPKTGIRHPTGIAVDIKKGELFVANIGTPSIPVFPIAANGDTAPLRTIRSGPAGAQGLMIGNPGAVGYDTKREQILVPN